MRYRRCCRELSLSNVDIAVAIDLSGSMASEDFEVGSGRVNRIDMAKAVLSKFIEKRRNHLARATPFSPVVNQHRASCLEYFGLKGRVSDVLDKIVAHGCLRIVSKKNVTHHSCPSPVQEAASD